MYSVARWFLAKKYTSDQIYAINTAHTVIVENATEKALLLVFKTDYGTIKGWFPKAVVIKHY